MTSGRLVLVATPIGNLGDLSTRAIEMLTDADVIAAEDTRRTRALLGHAGIAVRGRLRSVRAQNERAMARELVARAGEGAVVAFVTDAGMPAISDPGEALVRAFLDAQLGVTCVPGPTALVTALVLSGLPTSRFVFEGFLPRSGAARSQRLGAIAREEATTVLFESPHRVVSTLVALRDACGPERSVAVARELTKVFETVWRGRLGDAPDAIDARPRGEFVIVVGGGDPVEVGDEEIAVGIDAALAAGRSARDAADEVSAGLGVSRRRAYEIAITRRSS